MSNPSTESMHKISRPSPIINLMFEQHFPFCSVSRKFDIMMKMRRRKFHFFLFDSIEMSKFHTPWGAETRLIQQRETFSSLSLSLSFKSIKDHQKIINSDHESGLWAEGKQEKVCHYSHIEFDRLPLHAFSPGTPKWISQLYSNLLISFD